MVVPASASARDLEIGEACRRGLGDTRGAVVAMDPYTGRVISIVNPDDALLSAYQPCSVFKIVVAVDGRERWRGVASPSLATLLRTAEEREDPEYAFALEVPPPAR